MPIVCDVKIKEQVNSPNQLEVILGASTVRMAIFTGIANTGWIVDTDSFAYETLTIKLRFRVKELRPQYTAIVALASIGNEDTDFDFGTDSCLLQKNLEDELELVAQLFLKGQKSFLHKVSYQVNCIVETFESAITGKIFWKDDFADFTRSDHLFDVSSHAADSITSELLGAGMVGEPTKVADTYSVSYIINNVPTGAQFALAEVAADAFVLKEPRGGSFSTAQIAGPKPVNITPTHNREEGVDFQMTFLSIA